MDYSNIATPNQNPGQTKNVEGHSLICSFDFRAIDEMDPSLADGYRIVYDRECPFELRTAEASSTIPDVGTTESVKVKVLTLGEDSLRIELTSENDLFFHYTCTVSPPSFRDLKSEQKLRVEFAEFPAIILRMFNRCIKEPQVFFAVLVLSTDGNAILQFIQNIEHKFLDLLMLPFTESPEYIIRQQICHRYNALKGRLNLMQQRLQDVNALVKVKNPSLLLQLQTASGAPPSAPRGGR